MPEPLNATPEELEAIQLRWRMQNPDSPADGGPTQEQSLVLLGEIRERMRTIEAATLRALRRATRNPASRSGNSKHLLLFFCFVFAVFVIGGFVSLFLRW
jgi:hypothetical protein